MIKKNYIFRYLASGESMSSLADQFRVGHATVSLLLKDTLQAICDQLESKVMPMPTTSHWTEIADGFFGVWNFPNCVGAIDGKHVAIVVSIKIVLLNTVLQYFIKITLLICFNFWHKLI